METSTLRWIIITAGVIVLASIFLFGNPEKKRKPRASRKKIVPLSERHEPTLDALSAGQTPYQGNGAEMGAPGGDGISQGELEIGIATPDLHQGEMSAQPKMHSHEKITTLFLLARDNHLIDGAELLQAALNTGMEFGDMNIFHRLPEGNEQPVFSMANAAKPGSFERDGWNTLETTGVALFMTLPGPLSALDGWDAMLATARRLGELLQAELLDEDHNPFTRQSEAQIREDLRDYDRERGHPV
jgi:cell division protein ZipA